MSQIRVYEDNDFAGKNQVFPPGEYRFDKGEFRGFPNDVLSSIKVPLGLTAVLKEHEYGGKEITYIPGDYAWVPPWFNDLVSYIGVIPESRLYLSTDDQSVPAWIDNVAVGFTATTDGSSSSGSISADLNSGWYTRTYKFPIPSGVTVNNVWESTKNGNVKWFHDISGDVLTISLSVEVRPPFGPRNWVGVNFTVA